MIKKIIKKIKTYFDDTEEINYYGGLAADDYIKNFNEKYKAYLKTDTPEVYKFRLKMIKTIFKTWEQDINDFNNKDSSSSNRLNCFYSVNNCGEESYCMLVESNGRN